MFYVVILFLDTVIIQKNKLFFVRIYLNHVLEGVPDGLRIEAEARVGPDLLPVPGHQAVLHSVREHHLQASEVSSDSQQLYLRSSSRL
jgi:hypothetical protein